MKQTIIYIITSMYLKNPDGDFIKSVREENYRSRTVGFFGSLKKAKKIVEKNQGDLNEAGYYNYVVIEKMEEGLYPFVTSTEDFNKCDWWFYWSNDKNKWVPCKKPATLNCVIGFGMG